MKLQQAIRETVLHVAQQQAWVHPQVGVTFAPKRNRVTISICISGTPDTKVEPVLRPYLDTLRDRQTDEVRRVWPEIVIRASVITRVSYASTTTVRPGDSPSTPTETARRPVGVPPWGEP
jgi:hypothetical protein